MYKKIFYYFLLSLLFINNVYAQKYELNSVFIKAVEKAKPTVVNIITYTDVGGGKEKSLIKAGYGSGTIISKHGYIITNYHVLKKGGYYRVILYDGKECESLNFPNGKYYIADEKTDIALLMIDENEITHINPISVADSNELSEGEWVIAIGNPYGLRQSITSGIVSSKGRSDIGFADIEDFIQTDVSINPGNSGGPLINLDGLLVGINTAIRTKSGGFQGISFAIPSNIVKQVCSELINYGRVRRGWIGFLVKDKNISDGGEKRVLEVMSVIKNSPAEASGIRKGDIIKEIDGKSISSIGELVNSVSYKPIGSEIDISISRSGKIYEYAVILREKKVYKNIRRALETVYLKYGIELDKNSATSDVVISYLSPMSNGYQSGLEKGDTILSINGISVPTLEEFINVCYRYEYNIRILKIYRNSDFFTVKLIND